MEWFSKRLEESSEDHISNNDKIEIVTHLLRSQTFDRFLATKFPGLKRYGGEGAESMMAFFLEFLKLSAKGIISYLYLASTTSQMQFI